MLSCTQSRLCLYSITNSIILCHDQTRLGQGLTTRFNTALQGCCDECGQNLSCLGPEPQALVEGGPAYLA